MFRKNRIPLLGLAILPLIMLSADKAVAVNVEITPSFGLEERYDSNVFYRTEEEGIESDYITLVNPGIEVTGSTKTFSVGGRYSMRYRNHSRFQDLNAADHTAGLDMNLQMSRKTLLTVTDTFSYTPDSLRAIDIGIQTERTDILSNTLNVVLARELNPSTQASVTLSDYLVEFESPDLIDTRTDMAIATLAHRLSPHTTVTAAYGYSYFTFHEPTGVVELAYGENLDSHVFQMILERVFSFNAVLRIGGGATYTPEIDNRWDWVAEADFTKSFQRSSFGVAYSRLVSAAYGLSDEINIRDIVSATLNFNINRYFEINFSGAYAKNRTEPSGDVDASSYTATVGADWAPYSWMMVALGYTRFQQEDESLADRDIVRDMAYISVTVSDTFS